METKEKKLSLVDRLTVFIEEKLAPPLIRLSEVRYLESLQNTFVVMLPYLVIGSTATLVLNLGGLFAEGTGLNMPGLAEGINNFIAPHKPWLFQLVFISINLLGFLTVVLNGYFLGRYYNRKDSRVTPIATSMLAMIAFLSFIDFGALSENFDWPNYILGAPTMFSGIIISILAVEIYRVLDEKNITIKLPEGVPPMVAGAFISLVPATVVVVISAIVGRGFGDFNLIMIINSALEVLGVSGSGPVPQFFGFILDRLLWFVGLHGSNIVGSVMSPIWRSAIAENISAFAAGTPIPYMFTNQWINFYVRVSVLPIAVLLIRSRVPRFKVLGKLSLPGTIFNIAEPIMYGLPIVLNPLMFVPWVLGFGVLFIFYAILGVLGVTPPMVALVVWTMPAPIAAYIGSGFKIIALLFSLLSYVIVYFMFLPFFRVMENQELEKERLLEVEKQEQLQSETVGRA